MEEQWKKILSLIEPATSSVSFNTWFRDIKLISIEDNDLTLSVKNEFTMEILNTRYLGLLNSCITQVLHKEYSIHFILSDQQNDTMGSTIKKNAHNPLTYPNNLNPRYIFSSFVVGNSNRMAHAAALAVAEAPAKAYNPLFLYGGVGLGKTHLMHSIAHYVLSQNAYAKVVYSSSEKFTNDFINSIRDDTNEAFREKYRNVDVLLIDDIQFISGKEGTQEEFFHTFNSLYEANKQIIICSDRPPKEIKTLEDRLRSRFEWGLIADIQSPDLETRMAILRKKVELERLCVPDDVLLFIAKTILSNIRELEGALNRILAYSSLSNKPITIELADEALKDLSVKEPPSVVTVDFILEIVASYFNLQSSDLQSSKRTRLIAYPRQIAMYLCRKFTDLSLPKIGEKFGGRDHTTVIHGFERIAKDAKTDPNLSKTLDELESKIFNF